MKLQHTPNLSLGTNKAVTDIIDLSEHSRGFPRTQNVELDWTQLWAALRRNWWVIAGVTLSFVLGIGLILLLVVKPTYESTASLVIDPPGAEVFSLEAATPNSEAADYLETQTAILKTDSLAIGVIRKLRLDQNPQFVGQDALAAARGERNEGVFANLMRFFHVHFTAQNEGSPIASDETTPKLTSLEDAALRIFQSRLNVSLFRNSRMVEVSFASHDAKLAAEITNTLVKRFCEQNYETRYAAITESSVWLTRQLDDIRQKSQESNKALADYESKIGFLDLGTDDKQNDILGETLSDLNHQLTQAQAERIQLEAYLAAILNGNTDSVPELRNNDLFHRLNEDYVQRRAELTEALAVYGRNNPRVKKLEVDAQQLRASLIHGAEASLKSAEARETKMSRALEHAKGGIRNQNEAKVRLNVLKHEAAANAELYNTLFTKVREAGINAASKSSNVRVVDFARVLNRPTRPNRFLYLALASLAGLTVGVMLALIREALDNTIRTQEETATSTGLLSLGTLPKLGAARTWAAFGLFKSRNGGLLPTSVVDTPDPASVEAVRNVRTNILFALPRNSSRIILVSSATPQEGKTTFAVNLARSLSNHGRTCLIDADLRRREVGRLFNVSSSPGLSDFLSGNSDVEPIIKDCEQGRLKIVPAGSKTDDPGELISSPRMRAILEKLKSQFAYVVIDCAPILPVADGRILSTLVDGVVLIARYGSTSREALRSAASALKGLNAPILGVVINGADVPSYAYAYAEPTPQASKSRWSALAGIFLAIIVITLTTLQLTNHGPILGATNVRLGGTAYASSVTAEPHCHRSA